MASILKNGPSFRGRPGRFIGIQLWLLAAPLGPQSRRKNEYRQRGAVHEAIKRVYRETSIPSFPSISTAVLEGGPDTEAKIGCPPSLRGCRNISVEREKTDNRRTYS